MKKIWRVCMLLACAALCVGLTACGMGGTESSSSSGEANTSVSGSTGDSSITDSSSHEHSYVPTVYEPTCKTEGYTEYVCGCGDSYISDTVGVVGHTFDQENPIEENKAQEATCAQAALYYLTCECGEKSEDTFAFGDPLPHPTASEWAYDETHHWHEVTCGCDVKADVAAHEEADGYCSVCDLFMLYTPGLSYKLSADGEYAIVNYYSGTFKHVKIASTYEGKPVKEIDANVFKKKAIVSVEFPETLEVIGYDAFNGCSELESLSFPASLKSIGSQAFCQCTGLKSVTFAAGNRLQLIADGAFAVCRELTSFVFSDTCEMEVLHSLTFNLCEKLEYAKYGNALYLGSETNPYMYCVKAETKDSETYAIHEDTRVIADNAFENCKTFTEIVIPASVVTIGVMAFKGCSKLAHATFKATTGWWYSYSSADTSGTMFAESDIIYTANAARALTGYWSYWWKRS